MVDSLLPVIRNLAPNIQYNSLIFHGFLKSDVGIPFAQLCLISHPITIVEGGEPSWQMRDFKGGSIMKKLSLSILITVIVALIGISNLQARAVDPGADNSAVELNFTPIIPTTGDGDGISGDDDRCPTLYGTRENNGCPGARANCQQLKHYIDWMHNDSNKCSSEDYKEGLASIYCKLMGKSQGDDLTECKNEYNNNDTVDYALLNLIKWQTLHIHFTKWDIRKESFRFNFEEKFLLEMILYVKTNTEIIGSEADANSKLAQKWKDFCENSTITTAEYDNLKKLNLSAIQEFRIDSEKPFKEIRDGTVTDMDDFYYYETECENIDEKTDYVCNKIDGSCESFEPVPDGVSCSDAATVGIWVVDEMYDFLEDKLAKVIISAENGDMTAFEQTYSYIPVETPIIDIPSGYSRVVRYYAYKHPDFFDDDYIFDPSTSREDLDGNITSYEEIYYPGEAMAYCSAEDDFDNDNVPDQYDLCPLQWGRGLNADGRGASGCPCIKNSTNKIGITQDEISDYLGLSREEKDSAFGRGNDIFDVLDADCDGTPDKTDQCRYGSTDPRTGDTCDADFENNGGGIDGTAGDEDEDELFFEEDNCPDDYNPGQEDADGDGIGDACDSTPNGDTEIEEDDPVVVVDPLAEALAAAQAAAEALAQAKADFEASLAAAKVESDAAIAALQEEAAKQLADAEARYQAALAELEAANNVTPEPSFQQGGGCSLTGGAAPNAIYGILLALTMLPIVIRRNSR